MSPEQILSKPLSSASDLYSFGVMLYETLTGCLPFCCATLTDILQAHLYKEPYPLKQLAPHVSDDLDNLVSFLLMKEVEERMPSAEFLVFELERIIKTESNKYNNITAKRKPEEEQTPSAIKKSMMTIVKEGEDRHLHGSKRATHKIVGQNQCLEDGRITVTIKKKKNNIILICAAIIITLLFFFRHEIQSLWTQ